MTFEEAMKRLEEIVRKLEGGNALLDESLALYEEGVGLVKFCNDTLDNATAKVRVLTRYGLNGEVTGEEDFVPGEQKK